MCFPCKGVEKPSLLARCASGCASTKSANGQNQLTWQLTAGANCTWHVAGCARRYGLSIANIHSYINMTRLFTLLC